MTPLRVVIEVPYVGCADLRDGPLFDTCHWRNHHRLKVYVGQLWSVLYKPIFVAERLLGLCGGQNTGGLRLGIVFEDDMNRPGFTGE